MFEAFKQLGFTDKEIQIYLSLIMLGKANVQQLCAHTQIFRTSIYSVLNRLIQKGLVRQQVEQKRGRQVEHFMPNHPAVLFQHIREEEAVLTNKQNLTKRIVSEMEKHFDAKVRYESGNALVQEHLRAFFLDEVRKTDDQQPLFIYQGRDFYQAYQDCLLPLLVECQKPIHLLLGDKSIGEQLTELSHISVKMVDPAIAPSTTMFCDHKQILLVICQEAPHYTLRICDDTLAEDCRRLLSSLWNSAIEYANEPA